MDAPIPPSDYGPTFRALRRPLSGEQYSFTSDFIAHQLIILKEFQKRVTEAAREASYAKAAGAEVASGKVYFKCNERFTQWFFDNIATGSVSFKGLQLKVDAANFRTGYRKDFLEGKVVEEITDAIADMAIPPLGRTSSGGSVSDSANSSDSSQGSPVESKFILMFMQNAIPRSVPIEPPNPAGTVARVQTSPRAPGEPSRTPGGQGGQGSIQKSVSGPGKRQNNRFYDPDQIVYDENLTFRKNKGMVQYIHKKFSLKCSAEMYSRCKDRYRGSPQQFQLYAYALLGIYNTLGIDNNYLSIPGEATRLCHFELFSGPWNGIRPYFGAFYELEKYFESFGSYFTHSLPDEFSIFSYNPPFSERIMELAALRLVDQLAIRDKTGKPATVLVILPVWDSDTQVRYGIPDRGQPFLGWAVLRDSTFVREHEVWNKQVEFFDYVNQQMVPAVCIHIAILSTLAKPPLTIEQVAKSWHR